ncbi:pyridoxamine 5'-phosphate oxidase family protein [Methylophilus methylotrophus]|uniref:pyridoxamine 5'-phosphate oxidase family protein n=1 Tax=Methylophilus methylotrophus TaxID=17 RepID=UPI000F596B9D|nr:pyridoxamine 5'-phosphate oxidase family protein [Methylophilus methylotrophus]
MKIHRQLTEERHKLGELIADFDIAMLTFMNHQGLLISQPMGPIEMDNDGVIWFFTDRRSEKVDHLETLNLSFSGEPDGMYVSLSGHGEIEVNPARQQALWSPYVRPWFPEGPDSPSLCLLKFVPHLAEYWDAPHSKVVRLFAMVASMAASKPIGLGEHARLNHL